MSLYQEFSPEFFLDVIGKTWYIQRSKYRKFLIYIYEK